MHYTSLIGFKSHTQVCSIPGGQVEACSEAAKDLHSSVGPETGDDVLYPLHHTHTHLVLLNGGGQPSGQVTDLLMQPVTTTSGEERA